MTTEQVKFCRICDAVLAFQVDHCPNCGSYEGSVHLLEDRLELPARSKATAILSWSARILLLLAALAVLYAAFDAS